jgi:hypothetical protein
VRPGWRVVALGGRAVDSHAALIAAAHDAAGGDDETGTPPPATCDHRPSIRSSARPRPLRSRTRACGLCVWFRAVARC